MPTTEGPPPSGDGTATPADWIQHDLHPAEEGWFIVAHWPGVDLQSTPLDIGYVIRQPVIGRPQLGELLCVDGCWGRPLILAGALYVRLPCPVHLPF